MNHEDEFARILLSEDRRKWQDPLKISKAMGVRKGMTVADLACGPGFFTPSIASLVGPGGVVYAVDKSQAMLNHLRAAIAASHGFSEVIKVVRADVTDTSIPSGSVDLALFANVLHDLNDKDAFFKEVRRICRPDATVVDIDWKKAKTRMGPPSEIRLTGREAREILSSCGLRVVKAIDAGPYHYGLTCRIRTP